MLGHPLGSSLLKAGYHVIHQENDHFAFSPTHTVHLGKIFLEGKDGATIIHFYHKDNSLKAICGMVVEYSDGRVSEFGLRTNFNDIWSPTVGDDITNVDVGFDSTDNFSGLQLTYQSGETAKFGDSVQWQQYKGSSTHSIVFGFDIFHIPGNSICGLFPLRASADTPEDSSAAVLNILPTSMRLTEDLAKKVTSDEFSKLFEAKDRTGKDVTNALDYLSNHTEAEAWVGYGNSTTGDEVWICSSSDNLGELFIWTRDIGTKDAPNHVTRIGHYSVSADLLVSAEFSLSGPSKAFENNKPNKTTVAYKAWFTIYVQNKTEDARANVNATLLSALVNAKVLKSTSTSILKVQHSGIDYANYSDAMNSIILGIWSILRCNTYVSQSIKNPYLTTDVLNFDSVNECVTFIREDTMPSFVGDDSNFISIPKRGPYTYPPSITKDHHVTVFLTTDIFITDSTSYTVRAGVASTNADSSKTFGHVCQISDSKDDKNTQTVRLGLKPFSSSGVADELKSMQTWDADYAKIQSPAVIFTLRKNTEKDKIQKFSVIVGSYE